MQELEVHKHTSAHDGDRPAHDSAEHWDARYSGDKIWSGNPNDALVTEVSELEPGRALDVGCGEGADSVWLAKRGWDVTALDISKNAMALTLNLAGRKGVELTSVAAGLLDAALEPESFDLVSAMYSPLARTPDRLAENRLIDLVKPGGQLLIVHHARLQAENWDGHGPDPAKYLAPADIAEVALERGGWETIVNETRGRKIAEGAGAHHAEDVVIRLRKTV